MTQKSTIKLSVKMKKKLMEIKLHPRETYEQVVSRLLEKNEMKE